MWHYVIWIHSPLTSIGVVHSTWPSRAMWHMHAPTFSKWQKKKKKKVTLRILTHGAIRACGLTSLVVCINDKICDIRERDMTIRSEIWTTNICSLRFWDRQWLLLWGLILRNLECIWSFKEKERLRLIIHKNMHVWSINYEEICKSSIMSNILGEGGYLIGKTIHLPSIYLR